MKNEIFDTFSRHIWTRPSPPAGCGTLVDCPIKIILSILSEIAPRPMVKVTIHCCKKEKKIVKTIRQCLYGISINVFTLIIALLTGKKLNDDFFQFGALISQTWNFSNFNAVRVIKLGINCDRAHFFFLGGGGSGVGRGKVMIASHFGEALLSLPLHLSSESSLGTPWSDWIGAPNGSLPQNRQIFAGW